MHTAQYTDWWLLLIVYSEPEGEWRGYSLLRMCHLVFSKRLIHVQENVKEGRWLLGQQVGGLERTGPCEGSGRKNRRRRCLWWLGTAVWVEPTGS